MTKMKTFLMKMGERQKRYVDAVIITIAVALFFVHACELPFVITIPFAVVCYIAIFICCLASAVTAYSQDVIKNNKLITIALSDYSVDSVISLAIIMTTLRLLPKMKFWLELIVLVLSVVILFTLSSIVSKYFKERLVRKVE